MWCLNDEPLRHCWDSQDSSTSILKKRVQHWDVLCLFTDCKHALNSFPLVSFCFFICQVFFLLSSRPHFQTSPLIGQREAYHLRRALRHHSGLIYDCMAQIIKSAAEHRPRTGCPFPASSSHRREVNQSTQTFCHVSSFCHELHYGNRRCGAGLFVLTCCAAGFPPVIDASCCMGW